MKGVINSFFAAIKSGNLDLASSLTYQLPGSEQRSRAHLERLAQQTNTVGKTPTVIDSREQASIAITIVRDIAVAADGRVDYDAIFLLNRNGKWLVIIDFNEVEDRISLLTSEERKQLARLREWQDLRMRELVEQRVPSK
jgi:hypothetical protein